MSLRLGTLDARSVRLQLPAIGAWMADVDIDLASDQPTPSGKQMLTVGTTTLSGTVIPQGTGRFGETVRVRMLGGAGAWSTPIKPKHFHNDAPSGVLSSEVVQSAAGAVGETVNDPNPISYGADFELVGDALFDGLAPAARVLEGRAWYVDTVGTTQVATWPTIAMGADANVLFYDPEDRVAAMTADEPVFPGTQLSDARFPQAVVCEVEQVFSASGSRVTAWCADTFGDRFGNVMSALAGMNDPSPDRIYWYRISSQGTDGRLRLQAMKKVAGVPDTLPISVWLGVPGVAAKFALNAGYGSLVGVVFLNGDRTQPRCFMFDGASPLELHFDATTLIELGAGAPSLAARGDALDAIYEALVTFAGTSPLTNIGQVAAAFATLFTAITAPAFTIPRQAQIVKVK